MRFLLSLLPIILQGALMGATPVGDVGEEPHNYWQQPKDDPFTRFMERVQNGEVKFDASGGEKAFLLELLPMLGIPASSQLWVYSGTSLQSGRITPRNPRAVYFNEDLYVGYVPGGKIEIASMDPERGAIFYIFDIPRDGRVPRFERSDRCMNCHAGDAQYGVPSLAVESVIPGANTGSLDAFRRGLSGHTIPLEQRYGGWHVTGAPASLKHHGNLTGQSSPRGITTTPLVPGAQFDMDTYPAQTSDLLAHMVFEHQIGFINRAVEAHYLTRAFLKAGQGRIGVEDAKVLDAKAGELARYILFADEAPLPRGGISGDETFKTAFLSTRKAAPNGVSLKDLDLRTRLFRHRCSYMIYSPVFTRLPQEMKQRIFTRLSAALSETAPLPAFNYLPVEEKRTIRAIVAATMPKE